MNRKLNYLLIAVLTIGFFACKKDSDSPATTTITPIVLDGSQLAVQYVSKGVSTKLDSLGYYADTDTTSLTAPYLSLRLQTQGAVALAPGTYRSYSSALKTFQIAILSGNKYYSARTSDSTNTITINSISAGTASGSYSAKVWSQDSIPVSKSISGNF